MKRVASSPRDGEYVQRRNATGNETSKSVEKEEIRRCDPYIFQPLQIAAGAASASSWGNWFAWNYTVSSSALLNPARRL